MTEEKFAFQAEVSKLLDIVAHSLYSHKEIFLRELISNASDACDRLRYAALTKPDLIGDGGGGFRITLEVDKTARTLAVADNGIGMNRQELAENLGTIARSGTQAFVEQVKAQKGDGTDKAKGGNGDVALIGQFGVGFYSAFMVAGRVEVTSRRAGEDAAWTWRSDGKGEFTIAEATREAAGTSVVLHLNKGEDDYLEPFRLRTIVKTYSDHIGVPIVLVHDGKEETLNEGSALWTRPAKDVTKEQYKEFYHHVGHVFDEPWKVLHNRVEGVLSYTNLLFIPSTPPFDLFDPERKPRVKLYVKRVFITDDCEALLPSYLRFVRGVVDSEDLSLNVSREMLQKDPKLAKIKAGLVKRVLGDLKKAADKDADGYAKFWENFGAVVKEGLYEDFANREALLPLCRFRSTANDRLITLDEYVDGMKEGQEAIYYISGEDIDLLKASPQLEGYRARGLDVLLLTDPIDEFWLPTVGRHRDKPFKSVTRGGADLDTIPLVDGAKDKEAAKPAEAPAIDQLVAAFKMALGDAVKDVRASARLTDSAVCLVAAEGDIDLRLERMLRQARRAEATTRVLEVNPRHPLIGRLADQVKDTGAAGADAIKDAALLLLDQARIQEGEPVADPAAFAKRLSRVMERGFAA
ncbi:MAG: molecular chaperone HtpG [Rhodospirillales bacterium]|jgi:molecular chaperone HtpG|nr:molecular chaperone HtpG [Rhodospirillales bacterium]